MHGAVVITGGADGNGFDFGALFEHVLNGIESLYAKLLSGVVRLLLVDVANCDQLSQGVLLVSGSVGVADAAHTDDCNFDCHVVTPPRR